MYRKYKRKQTSFFTKTIFILFIVLGPVLFGCRKWVMVDAPVTSANGANVYSSDPTAVAVLTGLYTSMTNSIRGRGLASLTVFPALSADELVLFGGTNSLNVDWVPYYQNRILASKTGAINFSATIYPTIYTINSAIEGMNKSTSLTPAVKKQLLGEAKFMRAFCFFYLVNLYGDIPMPLSTDYKINGLLSRTPKSDVYQQIISDLKEAQELLTDGYVGRNLMTLTEDRVRPNKWAATALLARAYLFSEDWENAEKQATLVINHQSLYRLNTLDETFLKNSTETIWALQPTLAPGFVSNTEDAYLFILPPTGPGISYWFPVYLNDHVVNSFEKGDQRKNSWIDSVVVRKDMSTTNTYYYPFKYKVNAPNANVSEYTIVLRLAEQYLIRSEALAQQQTRNLDALTDLNTIRNRAGLSDTVISSKEPLLAAILHERQVELFTEWGHRWFDLKRTKKINEVMLVVTPQKGGTWNENWQLYPFNSDDLLKDPNLVQNPGY